MSFIKGNFRKYIFRSDKGYIVGLFKVKDASDDLLDIKNNTITFTGYFHELNESDLYLFNGEMINHDRYGEQFSVSDYSIVLPDEKDKIVEFLSSNLFPGIGEKKAIKIVDILGNNALKIILDNPSCLTLVPGVTEKQKNTIYENLKKYQYSFEVIVELTKKGFNTKDALLIYNYYKDDTYDIIETNPYRLIDDIYEVSFKKIDAIRNNFNITDTDIRRICATIKYVINEVNHTIGNTYLNKSEIISYVKRAIFIFDDELILKALDELLISNDIVLYNDMYFLCEMYKAESYIAKRLFSLANFDKKDRVTNNDLKELEEHFYINYNEEQKEAILKSIKNKLLVITGGPGTGKTTIIKAICKLYQNINGYSDLELERYLALVAPTGRAAKRISYQTGHSASTIHRFLKWNKEDNSFRVNEDNKSDAKFVIIDEASMVDTYLLYNLLLGLNYYTKIVIIGDYNQLPSVGPGQILKDIIESECIDVIKLDKLYRQKENSNITLFAHDITNNTINMDIFNNSDDLIFIESNSTNLKENIKPYLLEYKDLSFDKFQVLAPIYKGDNGIDDLNFYMQKVLNKNLKNELLIEGTIILEKDKVINLVNMPDDNVFNGDIGIVEKVSNKPKEIYIDFDGDFVRYTPSNFDNIKLGYTISIHKSQGSEFDVVILPILNKYSNMLYKKLIYTAVTRAKKKLIIMGEEEAIKKAILNDRENSRKTNLKNLIKSCIN